MITFTPGAVARWRAEHPAEPCVRVRLEPGGCAGTKYVLAAVSGPEPGDRVFAGEGLTVACPEGDLARLEGLTVDYVEAMVGGGYRFDNPRAGRSCGCGQSFGEPAGED